MKSMPAIHIRKALPEDAQTLSEISTSTFVETFAKDNRKEDMDLIMSRGI